MSDSLGRSRHLRDRYEECLRLADIAPLPDIAKQYRQLAQHYLELAEAEEGHRSRGSTRQDTSGSLEPDL